MISTTRKQRDVPLWLGLLLTAAAIGCALGGGLIIDRQYGPAWVGVILIAVAFLIAGFAYYRRVSRRKASRRTTGN